MNPSPSLPQGTCGLLQVNCAWGRKEIIGLFRAYLLGTNLLWTDPSSRRPKVSLWSSRQSRGVWESVDQWSFSSGPSQSGSSGSVATSQFPSPYWQNLHIGTSLVPPAGSLRGGREFLGHSPNPSVCRSRFSDGTRNGTVELRFQLSEQHCKQANCTLNPRLRGLPVDFIADATGRALSTAAAPLAALRCAPGSAYKRLAGLLFSPEDSLGLWFPYL